MKAEASAGVLRTLSGESSSWDSGMSADIAFGVVHVGLRDCVNAEPGGDTLFGIRPRPPLAQALALMRADAVKRRSWLGLLHGELVFWVGRIDGWFAL